MHKATAYLIGFHNDEPIVVLQINRMARPNERCYLLDQSVSFEDTVVAESWSNSELVDLVRLFVEVWRQHLPSDFV